MRAVSAGAVYSGPGLACFVSVESMSKWMGNNENVRFSRDKTREVALSRHAGVT
jgi:hypothetical protein